MALMEPIAGRKKAALTWLVPGVLGLVALSAGMLVPGSLPEGERNPSGERTAPPVSAGEARPNAVDPPSGAAEKKEDLGYNPPPLPEIPSVQAMMLRLALGTAFVLALCCVTLWAGKRWLKPLGLPEPAARELKVLEVLPLGGRCTVMLLQAGRCRVLAGIDQAGLKSLVTLPETFETTLESMAEGPELVDPGEATVAGIGPVVIPADADAA